MVLEVKKWLTHEKRWRLMIMVAVEFAGSWVSDGQLLEWSVYLGLWFQVGRSPLWWRDIIARGRHGSQSRKLRDYISTKTTKQREQTRIRTKPTLSDILPSTSLCFLNLLKQCHQLGNNCSNTWAYNGHFSSKSPDTIWILILVPKYPDGQPLGKLHNHAAHLFSYTKHVHIWMVCMANNSLLLLFLSCNGPEVLLSIAGSPTCQAVRLYDI